MLKPVSDITTRELLDAIQQMQAQQYRFITASCVDNGDGSTTLLYHFDLDNQLMHYRLTVVGAESVPSISRIYPCAFLVENEIKELFGVSITNIAIDYEGRLLLADGAPSTPMAGGQITIVQKSAE